jgi:hypothetical protein
MRRVLTCSSRLLKVRVGARRWREEPVRPRSALHEPGRLLSARLRPDLCRSAWPRLVRAGRLSLALRRAVRRHPGGIEPRFPTFIARASQGRRCEPSLCTGRTFRPVARYPCGAFLNPETGVNRDITISSRYASVAISVVMSLGSIAPARAADEGRVASTSCKTLSNVQQRIVDKAAEGIDPLRRFAHMTKFIYGIDMFDIAHSLNDWRATAACADSPSNSWEAS